MKPIVFFRKLHKWLGLIIGLQVIFWVVGGLVMSWLELEEVHGDHLRRSLTPSQVKLESLQSIKDIVARHQFKVIEFKLLNLPSQLQYHIRTTDNNWHYIDAATGDRLTPLSKNQAVALASEYYAGSAPLKSAEFITENSTEYRKQLPAWRIEFDDSEAATFYLAAETGQLMSVRNTQWRVFDFVWMLHIMDYKDRTDFNHPLLIIAAFLALVISISGAYLVFKTFRKRDFKFRK